MATTFTLSIDFGSHYIGIALIGHSPKVSNRVLYAAVIVVESKPLNDSIKPRAVARRIRRTRKTHRRRLDRLSQALDGIGGAVEVLRFCRRRGYSYERDEEADDAKLAHAVSREEFFAELTTEIDRVVPKPRRPYVLQRCQKHLNAECRRDAELRPARFENRHPTKCQWEGCDKNVPRKANATREQLLQTLFVWLKPIFDLAGEKDRLREVIEQRIDRLVGLARAYGEDPDEASKKVLARQKKRAFASILESVGEFGEEEAVEQFTANWRKTYSKQLTAILKNNQGGRLRYCRPHSREFVDVFLAGKQPPHRTEVLVTDLFGRSQQILFERIWQLVSARLLPLAGGRIDRVVVERVAFDVLAGTFKQRNKVSEDQAAEMYWHGPMHGFDDRRQMLKEEFDGRCAYCGRKRRVSETEHILPRGSFPFDSYFNILPACTECNRNKGARTPLEVGMTVHEKAFEAYSDYVSSKKPPHVYHTIKKGMLKLMTHGGSMATAQRQLALMANNLVSITNTQKAPRPLARFLASQIESETGRRCESAWLSGRHTALYRQIVLPEYDKEAEKLQNGLVNHAIDAIIAGCRFPSAAALENPRWFIDRKEIVAWREKVFRSSPKLEAQLPKVEPIERLEFFENDLGNGYLRIDLSAFNWNRQRKSGHKLDPFGTTADGKPLKRKAADDVLATLLNVSKRDGQIAAIAHRGLRQLLVERPEMAAREFVRWLQQTTQEGLSDDRQSTHPSDRARYEAMQTFVNTPAEDFLRAKDRPSIPPTVGIRCINAGVAGKLQVTRPNGTPNKPQRYMAQPKYRAFYVGYRIGDDGELDRSSPIVFTVDQAYRVERWQGRTREAVTEEEMSLLNGVALGAGGNRKKFVSRWRLELEALFESQGIVKWFRLTQGCYIEKTDGTAFQLRSFDDQKDWMTNGPFKNIRRVYRSPLRAAKARNSADAGVDGDYAKQRHEWVDHTSLAEIREASQQSKQRKKA